MRAWITQDPLRAVLTAIAVVTASTGAVQVLAPSWVLGPLGAEVTATSRHLFATVGMFMVVVGGLLTQTLLQPRPSPTVVLWSGLQKLGAAVAVLVGVLHQVFGPIALVVATFDLATALLLALSWRRYRLHGQAAPAPVAVSP